MGKFFWKMIGLNIFYYCYGGQLIYYFVVFFVSLDGGLQIFNTLV